MMDVLRILIAPLVWLASFSAVYGLHGLLCGHGIEGDAFGAISLPRLLMVASYALAILLQVALLAALYSSRSASAFERFVSRATGWVGLVSTVWTLMPAITVSSCF
jgi:hypothetical protein